MQKWALLIAAVITEVTATLSLRAVWRADVYPHMSPWRRAIEPRLAALDLEMLLALVAADYSTPEFLNPRPVASTTDFGGELATVAQEQPELTVVIVDDGGYGMLRFDQVHSGTPPRRFTALGGTKAFFCS